MPDNAAAVSLARAERFDPLADSSFARDVWANRPHEAEALFGPLLRRAHEHGVACPLLHAPVGPHPQSMYQIAFPREMLASFVPWLMLNRDGLTVLLHPETGDDYVDHTDHAAWFGAVLPLRLEVFKDARK